MIKLVVVFLLFAASAANVTEITSARVVIELEYKTLFKRLMYLKNAVIDFWPSELNAEIEKIHNRDLSDETKQELINELYAKHREKQND